MSTVTHHNDWLVHHYSSVESTQNNLRELVQNNPNLNRCIVYADTQNSGRGRHGREWQSPAGNLYCSFAFRPEHEMELFGFYAYIVALSLYDAVYKLGLNSDASMALKWPNDLMINDAKAAGILMEHERINDQDYLLIGVGVNITNAPSEKSKVLDVVHGGNITTQNLLSLILDAFDKYQKVFSDGGRQKIIEEWQSKAWRLGEGIMAKLGREVLKGQFDHIDDIGAMIIQLENGQKRRITAGMLFFGDEYTGE